MARPTKSGLDYFPLDVDFFSDDKIEYVTARFDEKGELITIKLLCMIYRNGFYTEWNEDKATIFAKRAGRNISPSLVKDVVEELVKRGFFDKYIFNSFAVLTSRGIQKRFLKAITDRKDVEIISEYWLIDSPANTQRVTFSIIHEENGINHEGNEEKRAVNAQTKVKDIKENTPLPPSGESDSGIKLKPNEDLIDIDKYFEDTYLEYPNKTADKQQGKKLYLQYLTTGKRIKGSPTLKFNHAQMRVAIQEYSAEVEGREMRYIKSFYNFLNEKLPGYVEKTADKYESAMLKRYKENWQKIKFKYTGLGIDK